MGKRENLKILLVLYFINAEFCVYKIYLFEFQKLFCFQIFFLPTINRNGTDNAISCYELQFQVVRKTIIIFEFPLNENRIAIF